MPIAACAAAKIAGNVMTLSLICASHTPMLSRVPIDPDQSARVRAGFDALSLRLREFDPEIIIQFSPDHFQGFFHRLMPNFCVGLAARSAEDWDIGPGELDVPVNAAKALVGWLQDHDFDVATSRNMVVDHGFLQMWQEIRGKFTDLPIIPIFVNCAAPPLPRYRRMRMLGEAVGQFAQQTGKRVLLVASGGLSHDPPVPNVEQVPAAVAERLINGGRRDAAEKVAREAHLTEFGVLAAKGEGPCAPLNPEWDRAFLEILQRGDISRCDAFDEEEVRATAGRAANEVLCWIAAAGALSAAGAYDAHVEFYEPIPGWIAGMAMMTAQTS
ncbi:3-carboxyethylcatechol 2,3-dioxygenase [Sphingobium sp. BS19]|uniref:3-carboxyethylcatechol 2,3-dioxygenase n=1 Tax=Sphingobium sp. BS19 TaxID=3018973 RepID=UPI0022EE3E36|nr:3-carboxyethylcatechol 2,3-dioxygenase [Sphingobium sp. BS19]GLJ00647.1 2,3-dihydroxyphenylpropionate/2,3-dihydroxicinnam ic acid 1,2-dioxygenase [Sphingobium sp. BS19]